MTMPVLVVPPDPTLPNTSGDGLRLYVARGTPNSARAEQNLEAALIQSGRTHLRLEIINVFVDAKRALRDKVIVTPTLIAHKGGRRQIIIGDLTDGPKLTILLNIFEARPPDV